MKCIVGVCLFGVCVRLLDFFNSHSVSLSSDVDWLFL